MTRGVNLNRRRDFEAALKRTKPKDEITLEGLATLSGVSKQRFVNNLRDVEKLFDMPPYRVGPRGIHIFPARKAIQTLLAYEKRNDAAEARVQERTARILGRGARKRKRADADELLIGISDLATLSRVMAETEQRERDQGLFIPVADVAAMAGRVFSILSGFLSDLDTNVDPNGLLPDPVRALIREGGRNASLAIHAEMKDMLSGDAIPKSTGSRRSRGKDGQPRGARARRPRG